MFDIEGWMLPQALARAAAKARGRQWLMLIHPRFYWLDPRWYRSGEEWLREERRGW